MSASLNVPDFLSQAAHAPVLDVRTPSEFERGRIPGALNLPLFSDEERANIGQLYKQETRETAILRGLDLVGPRLRGLVEQACAAGESDTLLVYCWRGGMRSGSMAWLLRLYGFTVYTLQGGYKAYRRCMLEALDVPRPVVVLGGKTGSGKTEVLQELGRQHLPVVDLEHLARHKGSSFGALGQPPQPTQEHFENVLARHLQQQDGGRPFWVEDEGRFIGRRMLPPVVWTGMQQAPVFFLDIPIEARTAHLVDAYGGFDPSQLETAIRRIRKRLGGLRTRQAVDALRRYDLSETVCLLLAYYDKAYLHALSQRDPSTIHRIDTDTVDPVENAQRVLEAFNRMFITDPSWKHLQPSD